MNTNRSTELVFAWVGFGVNMLMAGIGLFLLARFIPPYMPSWSAAEVVAAYQGNITGIRAGISVMMLSTATGVIQVVLIYGYLRRIEILNRRSPMLSMTQALGGIASLVAAGVVPITLFAIAAFRPDRSPDLTLLMNDFGWIFLTFPGGPFYAQLIAIGACILQDKSPQPFFPRWVGFMNLWIVGISTPALLIPFFKNGPFAWNGLLSFWIPLIIFFAWIIVMWVYLIKAINRDVAYPVPNAMLVPA